MSESQGVVLRPRRRINQTPDARRALHQKRQFVRFVPFGGAIDYGKSVLKEVSRCQQNTDGVHEHGSIYYA